MRVREKRAIQAFLKGSRRSVRASDTMQDALGNRGAGQLVGAAQAAALVDRATRGDGEPLDDRTRRRYEPALGRDLGAVRVHAGADANEAARDVGALAFTAGEDIVLGQEARATTNAREHVLAHELAHVAQAGRSGPPPEHAISTSSDGAEREARDFAAAPGRARPALGRPSAMIHCYGDLPPGEWAPLPDTSVIGIEAPEVTGDAIVFEGILLSTDRELVRYQLERLVASRGLAAAGGFAERLRASHETDAAAEERNERHRRDLERYGSDVSGMPLADDQMAETRHRLDHPDRVERIADLVTDEMHIQEVEAREFLETFERTAEDDFRDLLRQSTERMHAEARHYGVSDASLRRPREASVRAFPRPRTAADVIAERRLRMRDERERRAHARDREGLLAAAAELRQKRDLIRRLERELEERERREAIGRRPTPFGILMSIPRPRTPWEYREVARARGEYAEARARHERTYPILAAYTRNEDDLDRLAVPADEVGDLLRDEINERLASIEQARQYLDDGSVKIWDLPDLVAGARRRLRVDRGTVHARIVDDRLAQAAADRADEERVETALSVLGLVLSIAAIPLSGGASLAVGAAATAINVGLTIEHVRDYQIASTLANTDFSLAQSISHDEPSLFWLALEMIGTAVDVGFAVQQFRALAALRRAAIAGEREAARLLSAEAGRMGAAGERLVRETEAAAELAAREVRTTGRSAAAGISHETIETHSLARRTLHAGGHDYVSLPDGQIVRCSDWCTPIRLGYADVFEQYPHLEAELTRLQGLGAAGLDGAPALTSRLDAVRRAGTLDLAALEAEFRALERSSSMADDLRFVRYRRFNGGMLDFDDWVSVSRGGRGGGPAHQARVRQILAEYPGSVTEATRGGRAADVFTPGGPSGRDIYHQVGDINPVRGDPIARERRAIDDLRRVVGDDVDIIFYPKDGSAPLVNPDRSARFRSTWRL